MFTIYALVDPRDGAIRYVGCSVDVKVRLYLHVSGVRYRRSPSAVWVGELLALGLLPEAMILEACSDAKTADEREVFWIAKLRGEGHALTNVARGGGAERRRASYSVAKYAGRGSHPPVRPDDGRLSANRRPRGQYVVHAAPHRSS